MYKLVNFNSHVSYKWTDFSLRQKNYEIKEKIFETLSIRQWWNMRQKLRLDLSAQWWMGKENIDILTQWYSLKWEWGQWQCSGFKDLNPIPSITKRGGGVLICDNKKEPGGHWVNEVHQAQSQVFRFLLVTVKNGDHHVNGRETGDISQKPQSLPRQEDQTAEVPGQHVTSVRNKTHTACQETDSKSCSLENAVQQFD